MGKEEIGDTIRLQLVMFTNLQNWQLPTTYHIAVGLGTDSVPILSRRTFSVTLPGNLKSNLYIPLASREERNVCIKITWDGHAAHHDPYSERKFNFKPGNKSTIYTMVYLS